MNPFRKLTAVGTLIGLLLALVLVVPAAAQQSADSGPTVDPCAAVRAGNTGDSSMSESDHSTSGTTNDMANNANANQASGQPCPGTGTENAGPPLPGWVALDPGATHWYKFRYVYDEEQDDEPKNAVAILDMRQPGCIAFDVYTRDMIEFPLDEDGNVRGPVGRGTPFSPGSDDDEDAVIDRTQLDWVGSSTSSETYFLVVRNRSDNVCAYQLSLTGASVRFN